MVTSKEIFLASIVGEDCVRDARLWEAQGILTMFVSSNFPGLIDGATIESLSDIEQIHALILAVAKAPSFDEAHTAVDRILNPA